MNAHEPDIPRIEHLLAASLDVECPPAEDLADVILGFADSALQLRVAAHLRTCPLCQELARACRPPEPRQTLRTWVARLVPQPALAAGRRSGGRQSSTRHYIAAGLTVELTITAAEGDTVRLTGQVLRADQPAPNCQVTLRLRSRRAQVQMSDPTGFFSFAELPPGRYTLTVEDAEVRVQIRQLELRGDTV